MRSEDFLGFFLYHSYLLIPINREDPNCALAKLHTCYQIDVLKVRFVHDLLINAVSKVLQMELEIQISNFIFNKIQMNT